MSHEIDMTTGSAAFGFSAEDGPAWHGLGRQIPAEIAQDPAKIAAFCGADFTVAKAPVSFRDASGIWREVPNREAVYRTDTMETLEVMSGNRFKVPQPVEYFETFRDALAKNHLTISSAGALKGGRIVFVTAKLTDAGISVLQADPVNYYACIGGGYDGKLAHFGMLTGMRTVCWNTLSANLAATDRGKTLFRMPHSAAYDGQALAGALGLVSAEIKVQARVFNTLAGRKATAEQVADYFCRVMEVKPDDVNRYDAQGKPVLSTKLRNQLNAIADAYLNGPGATLDSAQGTLWGALNAVTYYADHKATVRDTTADGTENSRTASAMFGSGADLKARALKLAMADAGVTAEMLQAA